MSDMWFDDLSVDQKREINKMDIREQYQMYSKMTVTMHAPQTSTGTSYQQTTSVGTY